jgi:uncharacterized protein YdiU (UPF0061 family)
VEPCGVYLNSAFNNRSLRWAANFLPLTCRKACSRLNWCVPTSRVLCIVSGKPLVYRHGFQPAAILTRIAPCHIRFGTFEYHYFRHDHAALHQLAEYVLTHYYPEHNPHYVGNREDEKGLHAFGQQPVVGLWNCNALARAFSPLVTTHDLREALLQYETAYLQHYAQLIGTS